MHGVTLGTNMDERPAIGNDVFIGYGASVLGGARTAPREDRRELARDQRRPSELACRRSGADHRRLTAGRRPTAGPPRRAPPQATG
jgi:hypothetical protein